MKPTSPAFVVCTLLLPIAAAGTTVPGAVNLGTVPSIESLRTASIASVANGDCVLVSGYSTANDGGGGVFVWNSSNITADDDGTVIRSTGQSTGRWLREWTGPIHVEWWGTTDYGVSMNSAIARLRSSGGKIQVTRNPEGVCLTPINLTACINGIVIEGIGGSENRPVFAIKHNGVAIDCTGSTGITFLNFTIGTYSGYHPSIGYLLARDSTRGSAENHRFINSGTSGLSTFSIAALYNYGSENDEYLGCFFDNNYVGAQGTAIWTQNNIAGVRSQYQKIATGSQSTTVHHIYGGQWQNKSGDSRQNLFDMEGVSDFAVYGGFWYAPALNSYVLFDTTNTTSSYFNCQGVRGEPGAKPSYGVYVNGGSAQALVNFEFKDMRVDTAAHVLYAPNNTTLNSWYWSVANVSKAAIYVCHCSYCTFDLLDGLALVMVPGGSFNHGVIRGNPSNITWNGVIPRYSNIFDINSGSFFGSQLGDSVPTGEVGEYRSATVTTGTPLTSGTWASAASIALTAGDWDVGGNIDFRCVGATNSGTFQSGIGIVTTSPGAAETYIDIPLPLTSFTGSFSMTVPTVRVTIPTGRTEYLVGKSNFSAGSVAVGGRIWARRRR